MKRKRYCYIILCLIVSLSAKSQNDFPISVTGTPSVMISPSMGMFEGSMRLNAFYKGQFERSLEGGIKSTGLSADYFFENLRMGLGLNVFSNSIDRSALSDFNALLTYNYHLSLGEWHTVSLGLQAGYKQIGFSVNDLKFGSQYDPSYQGGYDPNRQPSYAIDANRNMVDVSLGASWEGFLTYDLIANAALAAYHLLPVKTGFLTEDQTMMPKYVGFLRLTYEGTSIHWNPSFLFVHQDKQSYFETGLLVNLKQLDQSINLGFFYRSPNVLIPTVGLSIKNLTINLGLEYYLQNKFPKIFTINLIYYPIFKNNSDYIESDF